MSSRATTKRQDQDESGPTAVPISTGESLAELAREVRESVGRRAYDFYEARGREHGQDLADWFRAEDELVPLLEQLSETKAEVRIQAPLDGLAGADLRVGVDRQHVIVTASRGSTQSASNIVSANVISLPAEVDPSRAAASSDGHALTIILPKGSANQNSGPNPSA